MSSAFGLCRHRLASRALRALLTLCALSAVPAAALAQGQPATIAVADIVDSDGRAHWPKDFAGNVDAEGYDLVTADGGEPRFVPRNDDLFVDPGVAGWAAFGEARHGCDGAISAILRMPNGDLILGGNFKVCGGVNALGIVRWNGTRWTPLSQPPGLGEGMQALSGSGVRALALRGNDVLAGGEIIVVTAEGMQLGIARWDGTAWHALVPGAKLDDIVHAIFVAGSDVYVGGAFQHATFADGSQPLQMFRIARWDGAAWHSLQDPTCASPVPGVDGVVDAITTDGTNIYFGGDFSGACENTGSGGIPANGIVRWDGTSWSSLGTDSANGVHGTVKALVYAGNGTLYAGGTFDAAGGSPAVGVARWNGASWSSVGAGNGVTGDVNGLAFFNGNLYAAGTFQAAGALPALRVARWDGVAWSKMGQGVGTVSPTDFSKGNAILADASGIYSGGSFTALQGVDIVGGVARFLGGAWTPLINTSDYTQIDGHVNAIAVRAGDVYVGGAITRVGEIPVNNVARWNGANWSSMGSGAANGVDDEVFALSATSANVYVGGAFTHAGGLPANRVARWDGSSWHSLGTGAADGVDAPVRALASPADTNVYAGGDFRFAGGQLANYIAHWNGTSWSGLISNNGTGVCGQVFALAPYGNGIYVGGRFFNPSAPCAGASPVNGHVAFWSGHAWSALQVPLATQPGTNGGPVYALLVVGTDLYIGGLIFGVDPGRGLGFETSSPIVRWRNGAWDMLGPKLPLPPGSVGEAHAFAKFGKNVYAASLGRHVHVYDDTENTWTSLTLSSEIEGIGNSSLRSLAADRFKLYVGGDYAGIDSNVGHVPSSALATYQGDVIFASSFGVLQ